MIRRITIFLMMFFAFNIIIKAQDQTKAVTYTKPNENETLNMKFYAGTGQDFYNFKNLNNELSMLNYPSPNHKPDLINVGFMFDLSPIYSTEKNKLFLEVNRGFTFNRIFDFPGKFTRLGNSNDFYANTIKISSSTVLLAYNFKITGCDFYPSLGWTRTDVNLDIKKKSTSGSNFQTSLSKLDTLMSKTIFNQKRSHLLNVGVGTFFSKFLYLKVGYNIPLNNIKWADSNGELPNSPKTNLGGFYFKVNFIISEPAFKVGE